MTSKETILDSIRRNRPAPADLPDLNQAWTTYRDPRAKFIEVLETIGGQFIAARDIADLNRQLQKLPQYSTAERIASLLPGIDSQNVDLAAIASPHDLANVDVAIVPGEFAVAENASVWVTDRQLSHRALYFLCQHLVLVIPADAIVDHMHAAYERIKVGPASRAGPSIAATNLPPQFAFSKPYFGAFISGPSKTADIEQTLVVGAHGPRSLTVCLLE